MGFYEKMKAATEALAETIGEVKSSSMDKLRSMLDELTVAFTELEGVGYYVSDVEMAVRLPPSITVYLVKQGEPTDEAFAALLANNKGRKTARTMIRLVRQANHWADSLRWGEGRCRMVAVELGISPSVRLVYSGPRADPAASAPLVPNATSAKTSDVSQKDVKGESSSRQFEPQ